MTSSNENIFRVTGHLCGEYSLTPGEFPTQRPVTRSVDVFLDVHLNKRLSKQWRAGDSIRHCAHYGVTVMVLFPGCLLCLVVQPQLHSNTTCGQVSRLGRPGFRVSFRWRGGIGLSCWVNCRWGLFVMPVVLPDRQHSWRNTWSSDIPSLLSPFFHRFHSPAFPRFYCLQPNSTTMSLFATGVSC